MADKEEFAGAAKWYRFLAGGGAMPGRAKGGRSHAQGLGIGLLLVLVARGDQQRRLFQRYRDADDGYIYAGMHAMPAIVVSLIVIAIGAWPAARRMPPSS